MSSLPPNRVPVAFISGGSSGIGRALVVQLCQDGYSVLTCGRDQSKLRQLEMDFPNVKGFICDVADSRAVWRLAADVQKEAPIIDLLISNAGGLREIDFLSADLEQVDLSQELRVNLEGPIHLVASLLPAVRRSKAGRILIVGSGYGLAPAMRAPVYSAAKAALHSFSKSLRRQLKSTGITVTELIPPVVDTPAVAHRNVAKLPADRVARVALDATRRGLPEVRPGQTQFLPLLLRLAPQLAENIVAKS